jgi:hypothetical protein
MNVTDLRRELNGEPLPEPLDPDVLVGQADARSRAVRRRRRLLVVATVLVAAIGLTTAMRAGWFGMSRAYVAGAPSGTSTPAPTALDSSSTVPVGTASVVTVGPSSAVTITPVGEIPATGVIPAVPYAAVGTAPAVRTIPDNTWVEVVSGTWAATWNTMVMTVDGAKPSESPQAACAANSGSFGCRGTVHNSNIVPGFSNIQVTGSSTLTLTTSWFKGTPASAKVTVQNGSSYWGVCWRLAGIPGWTLGVWTTPAISQPTYSSSATYSIYDAAGRVIGTV